MQKHRKWNIKTLKDNDASKKYSMPTVCESVIRKIMTPTVNCNIAKAPAEHTICMPHILLHQTYRKAIQIYRFLWQP